MNAEVTVILHKSKNIFLLSVSTTLLFLCTVGGCHLWRQKQKKEALDHYYYSYLFFGYAHSAINPNDDWGSRYVSALEEDMLKNGYDRAEINAITMKAITSVKEEIK